MKTKLLIYLFLVLILTSACIGRAYAQQATRTITISPPTVQVTLDPGKISSGVLRIINDSSESLTFQTSMQDFIVKDDQGTPTILPPDTLSNKYSAANWVAIYPQEVTVAPHQKAELNYYIQVPLDARPGGHYTAVMYNPKSNISVKGSGAAVKTSIGTLFYVTVNGPVNIKASINKFFSSFLWDFGPVVLNTNILNVSDIHITPKGSITLTNMLGQKSDEKSLATHNIFPGVSRSYQTTMGRKFMLGLYKVNLKATYGPNNAPLMATLSFIVFPWKIAVFIILMVIVLVIGYKYWKGDWKLPRRKKQEAEEPPVNS